MRHKKRGKTRRWDLSPKILKKIEDRREVSILTPLQESQIKQILMIMLQMEINEMIIGILYNSMKKIKESK